MIELPEILELKYVNGAPDISLRPDQTRIIFAQNGQPFTGAINELDDGGELNRAPSNIQFNVATVHDNIKLHHNVIGELVEAVNNLTGGEDSNLGQRLSLAEQNITSNRQIIDGHTASINTNVSEIDSIKTNIGTRDILDIPAPTVGDSVRSDLWFIKSALIGNKANYDPNGNYSPTSYPNASGIHGELSNIRQDVSDNTLEITNLNERVTTIEEITNSVEVQDLRHDVGERTEPGYDPSKSLLLRTYELENDTISLGIEINNINDQITGAGGLDERLSSVEAINNTQNQSIDTLTTGLDSVNTDLGTWTSLSGPVKEEIETLSTSDSQQWTIIGDSNWMSQPASLRFRLGSIETQVGSKQTDDASEDTIWGYVNTYLRQSGSGSITEHETRISTLEDLNSNLEPRVESLEDKIGDHLGTYGNGIVFNNGRSLAWQFSDGSTNPILDVVKATHPDGVELGTSTYPLKLIGTDPLTFNGENVVMESSIDLSGITGVSDTSTLQTVIQELVNRIEALEGA